MRPIIASTEGTAITRDTRATEKGENDERGEGGKDEYPLGGEDSSSLSYSDPHRSVNGGTSLDD